MASEKSGAGCRRSTIHGSGSDSLGVLAPGHHRLSIPELHLPDVLEQDSGEASGHDKATNPNHLLVPDSTRLNRSQSWGNNVGDETGVGALLTVSRPRGRSNSLPPSILRKQVANLSIDSPLPEGEGLRLKAPTQPRRVSFSLPYSTVSSACSRDSSDSWSVKDKDAPTKKRPRSPPPPESSLPLVDMDIEREPLPTGSSLFQQVMADISPPRLRSPPPPPSSPTPPSSPSPPPSPPPIHYSPPPMRRSPVKDVVKPRTTRGTDKRHSVGTTTVKTPRIKTPSPRRSSMSPRT